MFAFPPAIRKMIYTTNALESLHRSSRKIIKTRGVSPAKRRRPSGAVCNTVRGSLPALGLLSPESAMPTTPLTQKFGTYPAAQHYPDPRDELGGREGLDDVVSGARLQRPGNGLVASSRTTCLEYGC